MSGGGVGGGMSSYCAAMDIGQLKADQFGFAPFRKSFDEVCITNIFFFLVHRKFINRLRKKSLKLIIYVILHSIKC